MAHSAFEARWGRSEGFCSAGENTLLLHHLSEEGEEGKREDGLERASSPPVGKKVSLTRACSG